MVVVLYWTWCIVFTLLDQHKILTWILQIRIGWQCLKIYRCASIMSSRSCTLSLSLTHVSITYMARKGPCIWKWQWSNSVYGSELCTDIPTRRITVNQAYLQAQKFLSPARWWYWDSLGRECQPQDNVLLESPAPGPILLDLKAYSWGQYWQKNL